MKKKITILIPAIIALIHLILGMWWLTAAFLLVTAIAWLFVSDHKAIIALRNTSIVVIPLLLIGAVLLAISLRVFVFGLFTIPSESMERTIVPGDLVWVNKLAYGPRLPSNAYEIPWINLIAWLTEDPDTDREKSTWPYRRLKGYTNPRPGAVVIFNEPHKKTVFIKRCAATPGDTLQITNGQVYINGEKLNDPAGVIYYSRVAYADMRLARQVIDSLGLNLHKSHKKNTFNGFLSRGDVKKLLKSPHILSAGIESERADTAWKVYPRREELDWNIDNYGPYVIPRKNLEIPLNDSTFAIYRQVMRKFEKTKIHNSDGQYIVNGLPADSFTFSRDYYFMMGDNRHDSRDSRYFGPVPESDIIGKATSILLSTSTKIPWYQRILKKLK